MIARIILCSALLSITACQDATPDITPEEEAFARFVALWPGHYHNEAQVLAQEAKGIAEDERNPLLDVYVAPVDLPAFGENVLYLEWQNRAQGTVTRQRFYGLDREGDKFVVRLHVFPQEDAFRERTQGAHLAPEKLAGVTPEDMIPLPGCDIFLDQEGDGYVGEMVRGDCEIYLTGGEEPDYYSWTQMAVAPGEWRYLDGWFHLDDTLQGDFGKIWFSFEKQE